MEADGRKARVKLYVPLLAILLAQVVVMLAAPSVADDAGVSTFGAAPVGGSPVGSSPTGPAVTSAPGQPGSPGATSAPGAPQVGDAGPSTDPGSPRGDAGPASDPAAPAPGDPAAPAQDTSHCVMVNGILVQFDLIRTPPPCVPKWPAGSDNGGATYQGVTREEIKVIWFQGQGNEQVNGILATQGLAASNAEYEAFARMAEDFLNLGLYETYGRKVVVERVVGQCPESPPNPQQCRAAAKTVAEKKPAIVWWATPLYSGVFDEFAREGIITFGGRHFNDNLFASRRPFRFGAFMDGTRSAQMMSEYFCKKMAKKPATHSGAVIHATIGARGEVPRRVGLITPRDPGLKANAQVAAALIQECNGQDSVQIQEYEQDVLRAQEQVQAIMASLINDGVTTVSCMCDVIAPSFITKAATSQQYYPEWLMPGTELMDVDRVGRLYDAAQTPHMFGPGHLPVLDPPEQEDVGRAWKATGRDGIPCRVCSLQFIYVSMIGNAIQLAGPQFTPENVEAALLNAPPIGGWQASGGDPAAFLFEFGPNDYTGLSDSREVYWDANKVSPEDGNRGGWISPRGGQRYRLGEWTSVFDIPVQG